MPVTVVLDRHLEVQIHLFERAVLRGDHAGHERAEHGQLRALQRPAELADHGWHQRHLHSQLQV